VIWQEELLIRLYLALGEGLCANVLSQKLADKVFPFRVAAPQPRQGRKISPGRHPWGKEPSPRLRYPFPARAGEGAEQSEASPAHR
jgi:hypothetical protein